MKLVTLNALVAAIEEGSLRSAARRAAVLVRVCDEKAAPDHPGQRLPAGGSAGLAETCWRYARSSGTPGTWS